MCGEHPAATGWNVVGLGSSPHVRGAPSRWWNAALVAGIIPACAGSTYEKLTILGMNRDHPRMCGEHVALSQAGGLKSGIIPACAGSTSPLLPRRAQGRDHPRMCGEHCTSRGVTRDSSGSSPHVRGALQRRSKRHLTSGIIPACAGSTRGWPYWCPPCWDHPRMCGEHAWCRGYGLRRWGSSPHVRGARCGNGRRHGDAGIIPACAGSTSSSSNDVVASWDHPRMCGEHAEPSPVQNRTAGSSPHVRGALGDAEHAQHSIGIIPACAGSTAWRSLATP